MIVFPDYKNNILNISASLAAYLGVENSYPQLDILQDKLNKGFSTVIFIIFDALGYYNLKYHLDENDLLVRETHKKITSVFPSTTTNATTTMMSLSYPGEHCWLGWSLYFKEIDSCVDIFLNKISGKDHYLKEDFVFNIIPYSNFYNRRKNEAIDVYTLFPEFVATGKSKNHRSYRDLADMFTHLDDFCRVPGRKIIYTYCNEPDQTMHLHGATSNETGQIIKEINRLVSSFSERLSDTLLIISADHGQIDITEHIELYRDQALQKYLVRPLSMETRAASMLVDPMREEEFQKFFSSIYSEHSLYKTIDLIASGVFGQPVIPQARAFLGNYIAVPQGNSGFLLHDAVKQYPGNHGGLTPEEMYVPLILIET